MEYFTVPGTLVNAFHTHVTDSYSLAVVLILFLAWVSGRLSCLPEAYQEFLEGWVVCQKPATSQLPGWTWLHLTKTQVNRCTSLFLVACSWVEGATRRTEERSLLALRCRGLPEFCWSSVLAPIAPLGNSWHWPVWPTVPCWRLSVCRYLMWVANSPKPSLGTVITPWTILSGFRNDSLQWTTSDLWSPKF